MTKGTFTVSRRGLLVGGVAASVASNLPLAAFAADPIKMAGIYTVPVEQQWVSRIHIAAEALKAAGTVDYTYTENVANTPARPTHCWSPKGKCAQADPSNVATSTTPKTTIS